MVRRPFKLAVIFAVPLMVGLYVVYASGILWANAAGPPDARTEAPGETTCGDCHGNLNTGPGSFTITGPPGYAPGDTIILDIDIAQNGRRRWGFEITVVDDLGSPIGDFILVDPARTQLSIDVGTGRQYVKHTASGTDAGMRDPPGWMLRWASPSRPHGPITFYAAGCASNNNNNSSGDNIYTTHIRYDEQALDAQSETWGGIKRIYR
jgi:hypothetical protein